MPRERTHWEGCWKALSHHNCALDRIAALEADLERERIRLAACGVVAGANTRDSAAKVRQMSPEYRSASLDDVERAVDREIAERERREDAEELLTEARFYMPGHYEFIKPNGGLRDLMCRVDEYFGNQPID